MEPHRIRNRTRGSKDSYTDAGSEVKEAAPDTRGGHTGALAGSGVLGESRDQHTTMTWREREGSYSKIMLHVSQSR